MPNSLYHRYYDLLHGEKDYDAEVDTVLRVYRDMRGDSSPLVLDVGCGTGNHSLTFARRGCNVLGVDTDAKMIEVAITKALPGSSRVEFRHCDVADVDSDTYDLATAMFNVVNYIEDPQVLSAFFSAIAAGLKPEGVFVFDCFNGVAALLDPPRGKASDNGILAVELTPIMDAMDQSFRVDGHVEVTDGDEIVHFDYSFNHRLWTPREIEEALVASSFYSKSPSKWMQPSEPATTEDWKIMFTCVKQ
jgi:SAM-dependent methyltransferase